ncbi:MAG: gamma-glutamyltransferase family protein [Rhodospirillaceae bacterium]|nr:gamma-glutamyltransferase family protein [Rhodospirillaceae bacterium]
MESTMLRSRPELVGTFGVVASTHWQASAAGMAMLEKGGNAFDAAVAAGCVLNVVEPDQNGPGGDVPIILWSEKNQKVEVICGQGTAPSAISAGALRDMGLDVMPGIGHLPVVVPGTFGAWMRLLHDYGSLTIREVLEPAIQTAREGFLLTPTVASVLKRGHAFMTEYWPTSAEAYLPGGDAPKAGSLYRLPMMGDTYERVVHEAEAAGSDREAQVEAARKAWYEGFVAEAIDAFMRQPVMDTTGELHAGYLTGDDLANWQAPVEEPVTLDYGDYTVCKAGPWSQAPVLLQQLALLKGFDIESMDPNGADFVHTVQECAKLAMADREAFYGDPNFVDVPLERLLSEDYNAERRSHVGAEASMDFAAGTVEGYGGEIRLRGLGSTNMAHNQMTVDNKSGPPPWQTMTQFQAESHGDTCHFDIIDRWGNMISATPSGGWLSGSPAVPGLGFPVSVRGQMFWLDDEHPNSLQPGKRPRTTLTQTLALRDDDPYLAFGTPGGDQQDQWALHAFLRHVHHGLNLQEALDAPSFYTDHLPSSFYPREWDAGSLAVEAHFPQATLDELDRRGHKLQIYPQWGHYNSMTMASKVGPMIRAGSSPRRQCYAVGR